MNGIANFIPSKGVLEVLPTRFRKSSLFELIRRSRCDVRLFRAFSDFENCLIQGCNIPVLFHTTLVTHKLHLSVDYE